MKPLIGIMAKTYRDFDWAPEFYGQRESYASAVAMAGGIPVIIPLTRDRATLKATIKRMDGIMLAGGGDIQSSLYGEARFERHDEIDHVMAIDELRDDNELAVIRWAQEMSKPLLGICRGMQLINLACGGDLYQDIASQTPSQLDHIASFEHQDRAYLAHSVRFAPTSDLGHAMGGQSLMVNSIHHQAVRKLGSGLKPTGWSEDGLIEAIEGDKLWGVQFHPEDLLPTDPKWTAIFELLVSRASAQIDQPV